MCDMADMNSLVEWIVQKIDSGYHMIQESAEYAIWKIEFICVMM